MLKMLATMRIRTIKPEFWSHPVTGRLSDGAKCLAIALLNYADDDGYFFAEPALVRSALRPFDDNSSIVRRLLLELSRIEWIEVCNSSLHGLLGRIPTFAKHQRIDRPKPSNIKDYWDSMTIRRLIDDPSWLDSKGKERNGNTPNPSRGRRSATVCEPTPDFLVFWEEYPRHDAMKPAWDAWQKMRQPVPVDRIITAVQSQKKKVWNGCEKKHIPLPANWIRDERWDDEL